MLDREITSGKPNTVWVKHVEKLVKTYNDRRDTSIRELPTDTEVKFNTKSQYIIANGTRVRRKLDAPIDYFGERLHGRFRKTDIRWSKELYIVVESILVPGNPPLYKIANFKTKDIVNALYTNEQLQIV